MCVCAVVIHVYNTYTQCMYKNMYVCFYTFPYWTAALKCFPVKSFNHLDLFAVCQFSASIAYDENVQENATLKYS